MSDYTIEQVMRAIAKGERNSVGDYWSKHWCENAANEIERLRAELAEAKAQRVPDGYALVPVEPTAEMIAAGWFNGDMACAIGHALAYADSVRDYKAMLSAAKKQGGAE